MEYYCSGDYEQSSQQSCGTDGNSNSYCSGNLVYSNYTDYFCSGGECDSSTTPVLQEDCDDNDGYSQNYCMNSSVYRDYNNYFCSGGECSYSVIPEMVEECDYGCTNGECDDIPDSCSDTDGGFVIDLQGTVSGYYYGSPYNYDDFCLDSTLLIEYYCIGTQLDNGNVTCTGNYTGCINGACV